MNIILESPIIETPRVAQLRGLFDLAAAGTSRIEWNVSLPASILGGEEKFPLNPSIHNRPWNIGLITGPSGCGKSTIARHLWPRAVRRANELSWPVDRALIDAFPDLPIHDLTGLLSAVGFSSPPAWLRPFGVLSTGQQFRATLARLLAESRVSGSLIVLDEFTSVVDRTVARLGSAALAKAVRAAGLRFVGVTCHDDVLDWLQPDWVYRPAEDLFDWRRLRPRPRIVLNVRRCNADQWRLFAPHHYLSHALAPSAVCFVAEHEGRPVAFSAWLPFFGPGRPTRREHRTVTLPDYQGVGIGQALSALIASAWRGLGYRVTSTTTHPALIASRQRSPYWVLCRPSSLASGHDARMKHATTRLTAGFTYTGPGLPKRQARLLVGGNHGTVDT
ncbi:MAG: ABC transporter ATP-binding protein [Planctomycetia bacterium]|nr:ABC transporter ATP-binding protein [Planctomycetia bacterium]